MKNKDGETICSICERVLQGVYTIWRKIKRTGEHCYVCKDCEDTIPC